MRKLKRWQLMMIAPVFVPLHDIVVLTGRLADRWYTWTTEHTMENYLLPMSVRHMFRKKPNKAIANSNVHTPAQGEEGK